MKIMTKILIGVLFLTTLIPIGIARLCLFDHTKAMEFFGALTLSSDMDKLLYVLGGFMLASTALPVLAIVWLINKKPEGYTLAYITGFVGLLRGIMTIVNFSGSGIDSKRLTFTPVIIGTIIVVLTYYAVKEHRRTVTT